MAAASQLTSGASLLHNNLASSSTGYVASIHNSLNAGQGKLLLHALASGQSKDGPEVVQATSIRYLETLHGPVLVVTSTNGTQVYTEDASALIFFLPLSDQAGPDSIRYHQAACFVPTTQHMVIGTSKGTIWPVSAVAAGQYVQLHESAPSSPAAEVSDLCFSPIADAVVSVHNNGDLRLWQVSEDAPYTNSDVVANLCQAPVRVVSLGAQLAVADGPGSIFILDATTRELKVGDEQDSYLASQQRPQVRAMPPRKFKTDHRRGGGASSKHVSSFDEVKARNAGEESAYDKARAARAGKAKEEEEEASEEEKPVRKPQRADVFGEVCNLNAAGYAHVDKHGVELTRKQREELEKQAARRRYEELHKAGKTAEAQADLKRLEEVKKRREEAAKKKAEEAAKPPPEEDAKAIGRAALMKNLKAVMGKDNDDKESKETKEAVPAAAKGSEEKEASMDSKEEAGPKKQTINGADIADVYSFVATEQKVKEEGGRFEATDGSIEACRAAEADFM